MGKLFIKVLYHYQPDNIQVNKILMTLQLSYKVEAMGCNSLSSDILSERICTICILDTVGTERKYTLASKPSTERVYSWVILIESSTYALYNMHSMENDA